MAKYTQKEILTIIEGSSVKQKSRLYLRDRVSILPLGPDFILQVGQPDQLMTSVLPLNREEFNRVISWGFRVETGILNLYSILSEVRTLRGKLRETLIHALNLNRAEVLINEILHITTEYSTDPEEGRRRILDRVLAERIFIDTRVSLDKEGFVRVSTEGEDPDDLTAINRRIRTLRGNSELLIRVYLSHEIALRRFIEAGQRVPQIPEYEEILNRYRSEIEEAVRIDSITGGKTIVPDSMITTYKVDLSEVAKSLNEKEITEYFEVL